MVFNLLYSNLKKTLLLYWLLHSIHVVIIFVFQYKKPKEILILEQELLKELKKIKGPCEGDADCKTQ